MTVMHSELPLRPRPEINEALLGYLLRLAFCNGYQAVQTLRQLFSLKSTLLHSISNEYRTAEELLGTVAERVRIAPEVLKAHFENERNGVFSSVRAVQDISVSSPHVCLACLREVRHIVADWRLAHITHCEYHKTALVKCCPACGEELKWKPTLYSHCGKCKTVWQDVEVPVTDIPHYQSAEKSLTTLQKQPYRHHLYKVARMAMRFYDMQLTECRTFPTDIENRQMLFEFSYRFLVDIAFRETQLQSRIAFWLRQGPLNHLRSGFFDALHHDFQKSEPLLFGLKPDIPRPMHVSQFQTQRIIHPRQALVRDKTSAHFQLDMTTLAKCMQLNIADITPLAKNDVLPSHNAPKLVRDNWFDARDADELFATLNKRAKPKQEATCSYNLITLRQAVQIVRRLKWTLGDILKLVVEERCEVFLNNKQSLLNLQELYIDREQLFVELDFSFCAQQNRVKTGYLQQYFFVSGIVTERFITFIHEKSSTEQGGNRVTMDQLKSFMTNFLALNRWCRLRKMAIPKVLNLLTEANIQPVFKYGATKGFYIFKKTAELEHALSHAITSGKCITTNP
jgi:hypothetical protein